MRPDGYYVVFATAETDALAFKLWQLVTLLATNLTYHTALKSNLASHLLKLNDPAQFSPYKLLYHLQIVEIMKHEETDEDTADAARLNWLPSLFHLLVS